MLLTGGAGHVAGLIHRGSARSFGCEGWTSATRGGCGRRAGQAEHPRGRRGRSAARTSTRSSIWQPSLPKPTSVLSCCRKISTAPGQSEEDGAIVAALPRIVFVSTVQTVDGSRDIGYLRYSREASSSTGFTKVSERRSAASIPTPPGSESLPTPRRRRDSGRAATRERRTIPEPMVRPRRPRPPHRRSGSIRCSVRHRHRSLATCNQPLRHGQSIRVDACPRADAKTTLSTPATAVVHRVRRRRVGPDAKEPPGPTDAISCARSWFHPRRFRVPPRQAFPGCAGFGPCCRVAPG